MSIARITWAGRTRLRSEVVQSQAQGSAAQGGFSLIEVMIACGIFFMAAFAILALVSGTLRNARSLQQGDVDAGMAAAQVFPLYQTNKTIGLSASGDFGSAYRDFSWEARSDEFDTNGLQSVDIAVFKRGLKTPYDSMSILVFSPDAKNNFGRPTSR